MSILKNTKSVTRFKISDIEMSNEEILEKLNIYKIKEIKPEEEFVFGWSSLLDPYDPNFDDMSFMTGNYLTVSMRIDKKSIPAKLVKKEIDKLQKKVLEERCIRKLSRSTKMQIKESVRSNLLTKIQAVPNEYDVVLDFSKNIIYLLSTSKFAREVFEELIKETFNVQIEMTFPFTMGMKSFEQNKLAELNCVNFS